MSEDTEPTGGLGGGSVDQEASEPSTAPSQFDFSSEDAYGQFYESLPEELQAHDTLRNTKSIHALADQLVNAQSALGNKRLQAPQEDWGDEQWEDFYNQIRPENGEYSIPDELSFEGAESAPDLADETIQELVDFSAKMGLSQKQFDILYERYVQLAVDGQNHMSAETQDLVANHRQSIQGEWGEKYESNLAEANQAYEALASEIPELRELIDSDPVVANHPAVLKVFHRIAEVSGDALPLAENNPTSGFAAENIHGIKSAIQELDSSYAELIMSDPASLNMAERTKRQQVLDERVKLYSSLYPSE